MKKPFLTALFLCLVLCGGVAQAEYNPVPSKLRVVVNPGKDGQETVELRLMVPPTVEKRHDPQPVQVLEAPAGGRIGQKGVTDLSGEIDFSEVLKKKPGIVDETLAGPVDERARAEKFPESFTSEIVFVLGGSNEDLNFSISGLDNQPNIISELNWKDVRSLKGGLNFRWMGQSQLVLKGTALFGSVMSGNNQDSDFYGDNRTREFSRSHSDTKGGSSFDGVLGAGWAFDFPIEGADGQFFRLTPFAGFSAYTQHVKDDKGWQELADYGFAVPKGYFGERGANKTFSTEWYGPWVGLEAEYHRGAQHTVRADVAFHYFKVQAEGDWKLRTDFQNPVSFSEDADGYGWELGLSYIYRPWIRWFIDFSLRYRAFESGSGITTFYLADGTVGTQGLNGVDTEGVNFLVGIGYWF